VNSPLPSVSRPSVKNRKFVFETELVAAKVGPFTPYPRIFVRIALEVAP